MVLASLASFRGYVVASLALTTAVVSHAVYAKSVFYRAVVYLVSSKLAIFAVGNMTFASALLVWRAVQAVFLGPLRFREVERLHLRARDAIIESCFALTIFREEFDVGFLGLVVTLLLLKSLHWLAKDRIEFFEEQPLSPRSAHARLIGLLALLFAVDVRLVSLCALHTLRSKSATMVVLFAFEFAVLLIDLSSNFVRYILHVIDLWMDNRWDGKSLYAFYNELICDMFQLSVYLTFFAYVYTFYTFPFHIIRDVYLTFTKFQKRCHDFLHYRRICARMNELFVDATEEELAEGDRTCIICREEMTTAKKLNCGHIFHARCLQSWLKRQLSCPTCRSSIHVPDTPGAPATGAPANAGDAANQPQQPDGPNARPPLIGRNGLPPWAGAADQGGPNERRGALPDQRGAQRPRAQAQGGIVARMLSAAVGAVANFAGQRQPAAPRPHVIPGMRPGMAPRGYIVRQQHGVVHPYAYGYPGAHGGPPGGQFPVVHHFHAPQPLHARHVGFPPHPRPPLHPHRPGQHVPVGVHGAPPTDQAGRLAGHVNEGARGPFAGFGPYYVPHPMQHNPAGQHAHQRRDGQHERSMSRGDAGEQSRPTSAARGSPARAEEVVAPSPSTSSVPADATSSHNAQREPRAASEVQGQFAELNTQPQRVSEGTDSVDREPDPRARGAGADNRAASHESRTRTGFQSVGYAPFQRLNEAEYTFMPHTSLMHRTLTSQFTGRQQYGEPGMPLERLLALQESVECVYAQVNTLLPQVEALRQGLQEAVLTATGPTTDRDSAAGPSQPIEPPSGLAGGSDEASSSKQLPVEAAASASSDSQANGEEIHRPPESPSSFPGKTSAAEHGEASSKEGGPSSTADSDADEVRRRRLQFLEGSAAADQETENGNSA